MSEPAVDAPPDEEETEDEDEAIDFSKMSKAELVEYAEENEVELPDKATKAQIVAILSGEEVPEAPVDELTAVIRVGDWVRLAPHKSVPRHLGNRDAVVVRALVKRAEGGDAIAPTPYEYQDGSEVFQVRVRDTGEVLELTRDSFARHGTQQVELGV